MVLAKYTEVTNNIKFEGVLVQKLEDKKKSSTLRCWNVKIDCYCISVDINARINVAKNVNKPCFLRQRKEPLSRVGASSLFFLIGWALIEGAS